VHYLLQAMNLFAAAYSAIKKGLSVFCTKGCKVPTGILQEPTAAALRQRNKEGST
jgi:hypothetical protein